MRVFTYDEYKVFGLRRAAGIQREADGVGGFLRQQGGVLASDQGHTVRLCDGRFHGCTIHGHRHASGIDRRVAIVHDLDFEAISVAREQGLQRHVHFRVLTQGDNSGLDPIDGPTIAGAFLEGGETNRLAKCQAKVGQGNNSLDRVSAGGEGVVHDKRRVVADEGGS